MTIYPDVSTWWHIRMMKFGKKIIDMTWIIFALYLSFVVFFFLFPVGLLLLQTRDDVHLGCLSLLDLQQPGASMSAPSPSCISLITTHHETSPPSSTITPCRTSSLKRHHTSRDAATPHLKKFSRIIQKNKNGQSWQKRFRLHRKSFSLVHRAVELHSLYLCDGNRPSITGGKVCKRSDSDGEKKQESDIREGNGKRSHSGGRGKIQVTDLI